MPYNGTVCADPLGSGQVFITKFDDQERKVSDLLELIISVDTSKMLQERCNGHAANLICNNVFPPCNVSEIELGTHQESRVKPVEVCR
ncbi:hypothetical protein DPMN_085351 [Dreissena polymorpha]|nr:hypothetical protein DPMN_085351 [Dreissena polymorpha]